MAKAAVTYLIVATAFVILFLLHSSQKPQKTGHRYRRLGGLRTPHFDPLISKMEHKAETKGLITKENENENDNNDKNHEVEEVTMEAELIEEEDEVYFGEDGKLNLTLRLTILFPLIDRSPKDGFVGFKELHSWNIMQAHERINYRTRKELDDNDKNDDGLISFSEYLPHFSAQDIEEGKDRMNHGEVGWWLEQFHNADVDQDGQLNFEELNDFLHPEDSKNEKVKEWLLHDKIRRMDQDNDGMLNLREFSDDAYDNFKTYYLFGTGEDHVPSALAQFSDLDLDKDRLLTVEELRPIRHFLFPGELDYARYITTYLMKEVDDDHDGRLSLHEILKHENKFYHSIYIEDDEEEDEEVENVHDEF